MTTRTMRDSGVPWIGEIPVGWHIGGLGLRYEVQLGKMLDQKAVRGPRLAPYLRNQDVQWGAVRTEDLPTMDFDEDERRKFALRSGDLLVCEGGDVGRTAIWHDELAVCFYQKAVHRVRPRGSDQCPRYLFWVMRTVTASGHFEASGNRSTILHLPAEKLRALRIPFPPLPEQQHIAAFLDERTTAIDAAIAEHERNLDLLAERRRTLISHAVTRGLDANVATKDSGVAWIGEIPVGWSVVRIVRVARLESGHTPSRGNAAYWVPSECTIPWFSLADVWQLREGKREYVCETSEKVSPTGVANSSARLLPEGTVMLSRTASVGFSGIMRVPMATTQDFANWVCGELLAPEFLLFVLRSMQPEFERMKQGSTHQTIYMPDLKKLTIPLPPLAEQHRIVAFIHERTSAIDAAAAESQRSIDLLREYRQSLITAAVTGRVAVGECAS